MTKRTQTWWTASTAFKKEEEMHESKKESVDTKIINEPETLTPVDIIKSGGLDQLPKYFRVEKRYDADGNERRIYIDSRDSESEDEYSSIHESDIESSSSSGSSSGVPSRAQIYTLALKEQAAKEEGMTRHISSDAEESEISKNDVQDEEANVNNEDTSEMHCQQPDGNSCLQELPRESEQINKNMINEQMHRTDIICSEDPVDATNDEPMDTPHFGEEINNSELCVNGLVDLMNQSENMLLENLRQKKSFMDVLLEGIEEMEKDPEFRQDMDSVHKLIGNDLNAALAGISSPEGETSGELHQTVQHHEGSEEGVKETAAESTDNQTNDNILEMRGNAETISNNFLITDSHEQNNEGNIIFREPSRSLLIEDVTGTATEIAQISTIYREEDENDSSSLSMIFGERIKPVNKDHPLGSLVFVEDLEGSDDDGNESQVPKIQEEAKPFAQPIIEDITDDYMGNEQNKMDEETKWSTEDKSSQEESQTNPCSMKQLRYNYGTIIEKVLIAETLPPKDEETNEQNELMIQGFQKPM
ncbi:hypothetical protein GE061_011104 [Apolygus lucorum]|uniref:Uncharacterized protein n=1 Tax=Apolygus lucorum TaxID=248454 RepID=A0A8S9Y0J1_APOLU|nr:hypothetical protein GE061_011104 [Apolygus lucorum]